MKSTFRTRRAARARKGARSIGAIVGAVAALVGAPDQAHANETYRIPRIEAAPVRALGIGYDTRAREFRDACVVGKFDYSGPATGSLEFKNVIHSNELRQFLEGRIGAEVNLFLLSARAEVAFSSLMTEHTYDRRFIYTHDVGDRFANLIEAKLSPVGERAALTHNPEFIRAVCGDSMVVAAELGGSIFLTASFDFADDKTRTEFEAKIKVEVLFVSKEWTFKEASEDIKRNSAISIDGRQIGGNPAALRDVLGQVRSLKCGLSDVSACAASMSTLLEYAKGPAGFAAQLGDLTYGRPDSPVRGYTIETYAEFGKLNAEVAKLTQAPNELEQQAVRRTINHLGDLYAETQASLDRATMLLGQHARADVRAVWTTYRDAARRNQLAVGNAIDACFAQPYRCLEVAHAAEDGLVPLDPQVLVRPTTTYDYCRLVEPADVNRDVVAALGSAVGLDVASHSDGACTALEAALDAAGALDLRGRSLSNLRALRGIRNVRFLTLRDNQIVNLGPVASLDSLEGLDVSDNKLRSMSQVFNLKNLRQLYAARNALDNLDGLEQLGNLERLALEGNRLLPEVPVSKMPRLVALSRTTNERCAVERRNARDRGLISAEAHDGYARRNWAPLYERRGFDPGGVVQWALCSAVAGTY